MELHVSPWQGEECALQRLDARGNALAALQELAVLASCPHLSDLLLHSSPPGEPQTLAIPTPCTRECLLSRYAQHARLQSTQDAG